MNYFTYRNDDEISLNTIFGMCFICQIVLILLETCDQTFHRLVINFTFICSSTTYNCLSWNFLILFQFDSQILKLWKHGFDFLYTRLSRSGVVSIKWPKHYYLENSRTRNSKQSVYNRRSTNVLLMLFNCIINVNLPNNGMLYYGLIDE